MHRAPAYKLLDYTDLVNLGVTTSFFIRFKGWIKKVSILTIFRFLVVDVK